SNSSTRGSNRLADTADQEGPAHAVELQHIGARTAARDRGNIAGGGVLQMADRLAGDLSPYLPIVQGDNQRTAAEIVIRQPRAESIDRVIVHGLRIGMSAAIGDTFAAELRHGFLR